MIPEVIKILLVEDDVVDQMAFKRFVEEKSLFYDYQIAGSSRKAIELLKKSKFDCVIVDYNLGDGTAFDIFDYIVDTPFIFTTGGGDEKIAVEAMKAGAYYYHIKDPERNYLEILPVSIQKALQNREFNLEKKRAEEALMESEEKFRTISSSANDAIIMMDYNGNVSFWNNAAEKIFGFKQEEILGQNLYEKIVPDNGPNYLKSLKYFWEAGIETSLGKTVEMEAHRKNGDVCNIELSLSAVMMKKGLDTIALIRDITARKEAEKALQESEEKYRTLQENIPMGIFRSSKIGNFISANMSMVNILGFKTREEFIRTSVDKIFNNHDDKIKYFHEIEANGFVANYELELKRQDGESFWAEINAKTIRDEDGKILYYDGILEDITIKKQQKEELHQSKERLNLILQNIVNGVIAIDSDMTIFMINKKTSTLLDFYPDPDKKYILTEALVNCKDRGKVLLDAMNEEIFTNLEFQVEYPLPRTLYVTGTTFTDFDGKSAGRILILADMTREKEIEKMKTDFVSSVSHELKTPLTSIIGFSKTILNTKDIDDKSRTEFIEIIANESQRLSNLIDDVLSISKIESGQIKYDMDYINIDPIILNVFNIYKAQALKKKITIKFETIKKLPRIFADKDSIHQIAVNFIGNAIKFTPNSGNIWIRLKKNKNNLILEIEDTGMGIPQKDQDKIFDKFYRVSRPGLEIQGTGLGLSIVKDIVHMHNGQIELHSKEDKGTIFRALFPLPASKSVS